MFEVISTYILSLFPEGFNPTDMFHTLFYLIGVALILAALVRLIHKKASQYNHALSSAMALMFMYMLMLMLHRLIPDIVDPVLDKLPLMDVNFQTGTVRLYQFNMDKFTECCRELVYVLILSFCLIGLDDIIPDSKNTATWIILQFIIVCMALAIYCFILNSINTFFPEVFTSVAPMILVSILLFMVFLGLLKVILTLMLAAVNPLLGAVSTFFSSNKLGMALGKSVMCSFMLISMCTFLRYKALAVIPLEDLTLMVCCLPLIVLLLLWVIIGHVL